MKTALLRAIALSIGFLSFNANAQRTENYQLGPLPLRSTLYISERGAPPNYPPITDYWRGKLKWDEENLAYRIGEKLYVNASNWGLIGLKSAGKKFDSRRTAPEFFCKNHSELNEKQKRIADHIKHQATQLPNGSLTWLYNYDQNANDLVLHSPINSAFSQAVNIHFLVMAYCLTDSTDYIEIARKAGEALITPVAQGGLLNDAGGENWFEEGPGAAGLMPYILNAHIYSVNVLFLLSEQTGDQRFAEAALRGSASLERLLYKFDTGYWNRYDLRPRYHALYIEVHHDPDTAIESIVVKDRNAEGPQSRWSLCEEACDLSSGAARNDYSLRFNAFLETLRHYVPRAGAEIEIEIRHTGSAEPRVYVGGARPDIEEVVRLPSTETAKGRTRILMDVREFGWKTPSDTYIEYHAVLLSDLYHWQRNPLFFVSSARFANYHRVWNNDKKNVVPRNAARIFSPDKGEMDNPAEDKLIADCFTTFEPTTINLRVAAAQLPKCGLNAQNLPSILRRIGFRVTSDGSTVEDGSISFSLPGLTEVSRDKVSTDKQ